MVGVEVDEGEGDVSGESDKKGVNEIEIEGR